MLNTRHWTLLLYGLCAAARLHALAGELAEALQILALCETFSLVKNSRWFNIVLREPIVTPAQTISPRQRAGLKLKGQRLDGWETAVQLLNQS
ncbi:MAG: hypothetical protein H6657_31160 [Ardenticatenaceae bacterium]|nr:hypothetical protein [Ardenticatenaceae bacterium]